MMNVSMRRYILMRMECWSNGFRVAPSLYYFNTPLPSFSMVYSSALLIAATSFAFARRRRFVL